MESSCRATSAIASATISAPGDFRSKANRCRAIAASSDENRYFRPKKKLFTVGPASRILIRYFDMPREARPDRRAAARLDLDNVWKDRNGDER